MSLQNEFNMRLKVKFSMKPTNFEQNGLSIVTVFTLTQIDSWEWTPHELLLVVNIYAGTLVGYFTK